MAGAARLVVLSWAVPATLCSVVSARLRSEIAACPRAWAQFAQREGGSVAFHELCLSETWLLSIEEDVKDFSRRQFRSFGSFRGFAIGPCARATIPESTHVRFRCIVICKTLAFNHNQPRANGE